MAEAIYVVGLNKRTLKIGKGDIRLPGDPVPEAISWPSNVLNSHLSLRWLMLKDEYHHLKAAEEIRMKKLKQDKEEVALKKKHAIENAKVSKEAKAKPEKIVDNTDSDDLKNDQESKDLDKMTKTELQEECEALNLSAKGNMATMRKRIREDATT